MINLIWAMDENWLIGKDDRLPWKISEDLKYFKKITANKIVLMGDKTYNSMKKYYLNKKMPFAKIYVANLEVKKYEDAILVSNLDFFLKNNTEELFVIGGANIYELSLKYAKKLYITYILNRFSGNIYFPKFDLSNFNLIKYQTHHQLIFAVYERRK